MRLTFTASGTYHGTLYCNCSVKFSVIVILEFKNELHIKSSVHSDVAIASPGSRTSNILCCLKTSFTNIDVYAVIRFVLSDLISYTREDWRLSGDYPYVIRQCRIFCNFLGRIYVDRCRQRQVIAYALPACERARNVISFGSEMLTPTSL